MKIISTPFFRFDRIFLFYFYEQFYQLLGGREVGSSFSLLLVGIEYIKIYTTDKTSVELT